jgi:hypothetical protein
MKITPLFLLVVWVCAPGVEAYGQAITSAIELNRQSMQNVGTASQHESTGFAQRVSTQISGKDKNSSVQPFDGLNWVPPNCHCARSPILSPNGSELAPGSQIVLASPSPDAAIYFTTDGWTPTEASKRYTGPIAIEGTTRLQAFAEEPQKYPSPIVKATYFVNPPGPRMPQDTIAVGGVLAKGTPLRMVTASKASSEAAFVGEQISVLLDENLIVDGRVVASQGISADATISAVEPSGPGGRSGLLAFEVHSLNVAGVSVPLNAMLTLLAPDVGSEIYRVSDPTLVHVSGPLPHGNEAVIRPGMQLTAVVAADTRLHP